MAEVRTFTADNLQEDGTYLSLLEDGVCLIKSSLDNKIVTRINPVTALPISDKKCASEDFKSGNPRTW